MFREYYQDKKGFFKDQHDLALFCSLDKFRRYGQWVPHLKGSELTPIVVLSYNIPPRIRFLNRNMLLVGFLPGGPQPIEIDTFIRPLVDEIKHLERGTRTFDGFTGEYFTLRSYLCVVGTDMVQRQLVFHTRGNRARRYCDICMITSLYLNKSAVYCCHRSPTDAPEESITRERRRAQNAHLASFVYGPEGDASRLDPDIRDINHFRRVYHYLENNCHDSKYQAKYGLNKRPVFMETSTYCPPWTASVDIMHLLSNCTKAMTKHYKGSFGSLAGQAGDGDDKDDDANQPYDDLNRTATVAEPEPDIERDPDEEGTQEPVDGDGMDDADEYVIPAHEWARIAADQAASKRRFPPSIGKIVPITGMGLTTADWFTWTLHQSLIYFHGLLPEPHMKGYVLFVRAFKMTLKKAYSSDEMDELELLWRQFSDYYEEEIYKLRYRRLKVCLPIFHMILHIAEFTRRIGPLYASSQFPMERIIRVVKLLMKSTTAPNENCANRMVDNEMLNILSFIAPLPPGVGKGFHALLETDKFSDSEGRFDIGRLFQFAMRQDMEDFNADDGDIWPVLDADKPWTPTRFEFAPRRGRPLPRSDSDSDDASDSDEEHDDDVGGNPGSSIVDRNIALTDGLSELQWPLSVRERDHILSWLRYRDILPNYLYNAPRTISDQRDFIDKLRPQKFRTLVIAMKEAAISDPIAYTVRRPDQVDTGNGCEVVLLLCTHTVHA